MLKFHVFKSIVWFFAVIISERCATPWFAMLTLLCLWRMIWHLHFLYRYIMK